MNLQRQGQLALYPPALGQEAAQVGAAAALRDDDWVFPQYRELGIFVWRGVDPAGVGAEWRGVQQGGTGLIERCIAPICTAVGSHALHAVGAAMAARYLGEDSVTLACFGDGATSTGDVHEALNFAAVFEAPVVFFVQNNQWAISVPVGEQLKAPIAHKGAGYGMPGVRVDGNDVLACYSVVRDAVDRARAGQGPTLVEAVTYRMGPHTTSDDPTRYRTPEDDAPWQALDPIRRYQHHLQMLGVWSDDVGRHALDRAAELRTRARDAIFDAPDPDPVEMFDLVFAQRTPELEAQAALLADERAREE
jgi:pyruvate dehydrogenase E1 component alpha subunit